MTIHAHHSFNVYSEIESDIRHDSNKRKKTCLVIIKSFDVDKRGGGCGTVRLELEGTFFGAWQFDTAYRVQVLVMIEDQAW